MLAFFGNQILTADFGRPGRIDSSALRPSLASMATTSVAPTACDGGGFPGR